ncbi:MAG: methyltransferase domain-containing protein [Spirochaetales bacterium]|nr:methyltransferase domain-containing protein [Spirochaetales bacterium]
MSNYDKYYLTEDLFGAPYPELIAFFENYPDKGTILDLGCGQGRDSLSLAKIGYNVVGVDSSKTGIKQMLEKAAISNLNITGLVDDIYKFEISENHDIVLLDSMFHFLKRDKERETQFIKRICKELKTERILCICLQNSKKKVDILRETLEDANIKFEILNDSSFNYSFIDKESNSKIVTKYIMLIIRKTS